MFTSKTISRIVIKGDLSRDAAASACAALPDGWVVRFSPETRTLDQNANLHAMISDIAKQATWAGSKRSIEDWKALFVSAHRTVLKQAGEVIPGLEGEFVQLRRSTAAMGIKELGSLIEYVQAWGTQNGVRFSARDQEWKSF